ncbi:MAG: hypothetical protein F2667_07300 [Actinobacteria bacterium]|uniref:Unannotated protein n=1 Tax=freshwater metagenome TaxID=449393 RepID=A0A6J6QQY6_9ZZZZ|nr:hypothetical protein [Actinomycetota bacterium]
MPPTTAAQTAQQTRSGWSRLHQRTDALRGVVASLDAGRPLTWDDDLADAFDDLDDLLATLHGTWSRRLQCRIDLVLESGRLGLTEAVADAWAATARDLPGLRRALDEHAARPRVRALDRAEQRLVAIAAGRATFTDPVDLSAAAGASLVASARAA